jgi:hypothetical protein
MGLRSSVSPGKFLSLLQAGVFSVPLSGKVNVYPCVVKSVAVVSTNPNEKKKNISYMFNIWS